MQNFQSDIFKNNLEWIDTFIEVALYRLHTAILNRPLSNAATKEV